jgi:hypothetical protein
MESSKYPYKYPALIALMALLNVGIVIYGLVEVDTILYHNLVAAVLCTALAVASGMLAHRTEATIKAYNEAAKHLGDLLR